MQFLVGDEHKVVQNFHSAPIMKLQHPLRPRRTLLACMLKDADDKKQVVDDFQTSVCCWQSEIIVLSVITRSVRISHLQKSA